MNAQQTTAARSIPACAGEPPQRVRRPGLPRVYPRVCGGAKAVHNTQGRRTGLSPRVRGSLRTYAMGILGLRSIPACAGEPIPATSSRRTPKVYPRVCGGAAVKLVAGTLFWGLSPRVRGSLFLSAWGGICSRSIPACAGEPTCVPLAHGLGEVYPRVCGGARRRWAGSLYGIGLSPRVRGSPMFIRPSIPWKRSIPACAGEPAMTHGSKTRTAVYPRVCGGAFKRDNNLDVAAGLSPRVRGSPSTPAAGLARKRSIPACAGEPAAAVAPWRSSRCRGRVYPRVCGGAGWIVVSMSVYDGLSPRVRGSPRRPPAGVKKRGSIPACAGEPRVGRRRMWCGAVYPRVCGGAYHASGGVASLSGLSPRVRGSHHELRVLDYRSGSIPACAGEPVVSSRESGTRPAPAVYPRVCGGAGSMGETRFRPAGLSPRVRGSQPFFRERKEARRSIPACAGEPRVWAAAFARSEVYPRVCGGASYAGIRAPVNLGLSPRVRGSQAAVQNDIAYPGSIPACAGEPSGA